VKWSIALVAYGCGMWHYCSFAQSFDISQATANNK